ncbi:MAG TPA: glycosyltransferase, partial [Candidatus Acidoferrales bacterium]|nr:glycosyltransferase [Candidatus Acidoferrales bacterium]
MDPLVTIVITSYNYGEYVGDALSSALAQTYRNLEVLVLDNASTDNSLEVIRSFSDRRIRVIARSENVGIQRNHNDAIREARGEFVVFLSADDMLLPTLVEDVLAYRRAHPEVDIVYASVVIVDKDGNWTQYFDQPALDACETYWGRNEFASLLTRDSYMYLPTVLFPKAVFDEIGLLDETLSVVLDYEFDIRMAGAGKRFAFFSKPEALIRFHGENRSGVKNFVKTGGQLREFCSILERYTQPRFHPRLAGYGLELNGMLQKKVLEIGQAFPNEYQAQRPELDPLVARAAASIATVPAVGEAVLRGEGLISVVIPHGGRTAPLQRALQSLAAQSYANWEAIVVCDGTPDPSALIEAMRLGERVRVTRLMRGARGQSAARNAGLREVNGEIVAYLDDDNRLTSRYLAALAAAFSNPSVAATIARADLAVVDP